MVDPKQLTTAAADSGSGSGSGNADAIMHCPYFYDSGAAIWKKATPDLPFPQEESESANLTVSTYNVLAQCPLLPSHTRYPLLVKNILSADAEAEILALQEATEDFLSYLLQDRDIGVAFPFCSHGPPGQEDVEPLPNHQNVVVLSKYEFDWQSIPPEHGNSHSIIVKFRDLGEYEDITNIYRPLTLAAVHLEPGLDDGASLLREAELREVMSCLDPSNPTILAGDFNIPTSSHTIEHALNEQAITPQDPTSLYGAEKLLDGFLDAWTVSRIEEGLPPDEDVTSSFEGEQGATYDPRTNAVAADRFIHALDMRPQRFDRILVRGEPDSFQILSLNKFGSVVGEPDREEKHLHASDHWGVRAVLRLGAYSNAQSCTGCGNIQKNLVQAPGLLANPAGVMAAMESAHAVPSAKLIEDRAAVFRLLKEIILEPSSSDTTTEMGPSNVRMEIVPVGSYGLGVWTLSSDINCVCIGPFSGKTFVSLAVQRLNRATDKNVRIVRASHDRQVSLEVIVHGIRVGVHYAISENWSDASRLTAPDQIRDLANKHKLALKDCWTVDYLRRSIPDIAKFQLAYRFIKTWAEKRGIYGGMYLRGIHITVMLAAVYKTWACRTARLSVPDILATFFSHYARFDFEKDVVYDPFFHKNLHFKRPAGYPLVLLGYFAPSTSKSLANTGQYSQFLRFLTEEVTRADQMLSTGDMTWAALLEDSGAADFLRSSRMYGKIDMQFWGGSLIKGRGSVLWVESRLPSLLKDMDKRLPGRLVRAWPARWVDEAERCTEHEEEAGHYQCCYLIGLGEREDDKIDGPVMRATILEILGRFEGQIRGDKERFSPQTSWIGTSLATPADVRSKVVDSRDWSEYVFTEDVPDDEDGKAGQQQPPQDPLLDENEDEASSSSKKKRQTKPHTNQPRSATAPRREGTGRFRTAQEVLNRLRWDPGLDSADFVVGYEDRFAGAMEKDLDGWRSEQTDDEFIPQHRVLYFRRKTDGVKLWERKTRTDLLFSSG